MSDLEANIEAIGRTIALLREELDAMQEQIRDRETAIEALVRLRAAQESEAPDAE